MLMESSLKIYEQMLSFVPQLISPFSAIPVMLLLAYSPLPLRIRTVVKSRGRYNNVIPREQFDSLKGEARDIAHRCTGAHNNGLEALLMFSIAVVMATIAKCDYTKMRQASSLFIIMRTIYVPIYIYGRRTLVSFLRTVVFAVGVFACLYLMCSAAFQMNKTMLS